jgi:hypothetical protein
LGWAKEFKPSRRELVTKKKGAANQHVWKISLRPILKLDSAERVDEHTPDIEPTDDSTKRRERH